MNLSITPISSYNQNKNHVSFEAIRTAPEAAQIINKITGERYLDLANPEHLRNGLNYHFQKHEKKIMEEYKGYYLSPKETYDLYDNTVQSYSRPMKELKRITSGAIDVDPESVDKVGQVYFDEVLKITEDAKKIPEEQGTLSKIEYIQNALNAARERAIKALKILGI